MKLIIAGSRDYEADPNIIVKAVSISGINGIEMIVSGGAAGIDWAAEQYASNTGIPLRVFDANWSFYGKSAGVRRNKQMAEFVASDGTLLAITHYKESPSTGTRDMIDTAKKCGIPVFVVDDEDLRGYNG